MARRRKLTAVPKKRKSSKKKSKPMVKLEKHIKKEVWGIIFAVLGVLTFLALSGKLGRLGEYFSLWLTSFFGQGALFAPVIFILLSIAFFTSRTIKLDYTRIFGIFLMFFGIMGFLHTFLNSAENMLSNSAEGGGYVGFASSAIFVLLIGQIGARVVLIGVLLAGIVITFPISVSGTFVALFNLIKKLIFEKSKSSDKKKKEKPVIPSYNKKLAEEKRKKFEKNTDDKKEEKPLIAEPVGDWEPPSLDLLSNKKSDIIEDRKLLEKKSDLIAYRLAEFGIDVKMRDFHQGPSVTQFTLEPAEGVKLSKILGLKREIALALSAKSIRIEAPIPGKNLVGIEVPNDKRSAVYLREVLESKAFQEIKSSLRLAIGQDVSGQELAFDLAEMPHLLIAGATGAGKSVGMNSFLISLLFQNSSSQLKMILIDPKRVELAPFNGIPHLLTPVITEADKALLALKWAVAEMMRRYKEMGDNGYRNIEEYNKAEKEKMPKIVIVIDELADLMMRQYKKETEAVICRIAQMARAVGMHLIVATQRPSVDVITGLIKANIPARISYTVTSSIDSRTILDSIGAEDLLGKGDMLITTSKLPKPLRAQGVMVSSEEIKRVINRIKITSEPEFDDSILSFETGGGTGEFSEGSGDTDDLLEEAIEVIRSSKKASASLLQRRLSVGYARAARILDILEERGMIGASRGAKPREIYL